MITRIITIFMGLSLSLATVSWGAQGDNQSDADLKHAVVENVHLYSAEMPCTKAWWPAWLWWGWPITESHWFVGVKQQEVIELTGTGWLGKLNNGLSWLTQKWGNPYVWKLDSKVFGVAESTAVSYPERDEKVAHNCVELLKIVPKEAWNRRKNNTTLLAATGLLTLCASMGKGIYESETRGPSGFYGGCVAGVAGAMMLLWYAWQRCYSLQEVLPKSFSPTVQNALNNTKVWELIRPDILAGPDFKAYHTIVRHPGVNRVLKGYQLPPVSTPELCLTCLKRFSASDDKRHNDHRGLLFWGKGRPLLQNETQTPQDPSFIVMGEEPLPTMRSESLETTIQLNIGSST